MVRGRRNIPNRMKMSSKVSVGKQMDVVMVQIKRSWYELYRMLNK